MLEKIKRGEIYWVNWNPSRSSEQKGIRPALIIQNDIGNEYSPTTIIASLSTAMQKQYPFTVNITSQESGLPKDSTINLSTIMTIDKTRLTDKCGELDQSRMFEVDQAIMTSLGLK